MKKRINKEKDKLIKGLTEKDFNSYAILGVLLIVAGLFSRVIGLILSALSIIFVIFGCVFLISSVVMYYSDRKGEGSLLSK